MIACLDVDYRASQAVGAAVVFGSWNDETIIHQRVQRIGPVEPYVPGEFYRRELPCLLCVLDALDPVPRTVVVDGYVWLDQGRPGLGAKLYEALDQQVAVIGVAKKSFRGNRAAMAVRRGRSRRPLYVTAAGMDVERAARHIQQMNGPYRTPTLLQRADRLCRTGGGGNR